MRPQVRESDPLEYPERRMAMDRRTQVHLLHTLGVLAGSLALLGCPKRPEVAQAGPAAIGPVAAKASAIRGDQKTALESDFEWLKAHPGAKVRIEGNCDERGTAEYNLALGERRAETVKTSLMAEGIAADRISTISYGKERPFVLGHDENAWEGTR